MRAPSAIATPTGLPPVVAELTARFLGEVDRRLPERLTGLFLHGSLCWGEFFASSDVDFVGLWDTLPTGDELDLLAEAHAETLRAHPRPAFDGFHATAPDLASDPAGIPHRPVFFGGSFDPRGTSDVNPVTWHELATRPVVVRGVVPPVQTDLDALVAYSRQNLDTYWRGILERLDAAGTDTTGADDDAVCWVVLGAPRLHHLISRGELTSKSGGGRHVVDALDPRWHRIAREAVRIRESPGAPSLYDDVTGRGRDARDLLAWLVQERWTGPREARDPFRAGLRACPYRR